MDIREKFRKDETELRALVEKALDYIGSKKLEQAFLYVRKSETLSVSVRKQIPEKVDYSNGLSMCVTVFNDYCRGSASSSNLSESSVFSAIDAAADISAHTSRDEFCGLPEKEDVQYEVTDFDTFYPEDADPDAMIERAAELERICLAREGIKQAVSSTAANSSGMIVAGSTMGQVVAFPSSFFSSSVGLVAEQDGVMERGSGYHFSYRSDKVWPLEKIADEAVNDTLSRLGGRKIATRTAPVILDKDVASSLFMWLGTAISGRPQYRRTSFLVDCLGKQVMPEWLTIHEDPHIVGEMASDCMDSTGARTTKKDFVTNGVVASYMLSAYSARRLKMRNTGNADGNYTWLITNSGISRTDLERKMDTGLVITDMMGVNFNSVTGDVSTGCSGYWLENGVKAYPVKEITVAGNCRDLFMNIVAISNDINEKSSVKTGSVLLDHMQIAGQ